MTDEEKQNILRMDPQVLAWIGDGYLTLAVRVWLVNQSSSGAGALHSKMKTYISAVAQAKEWEKIFDRLTDGEKDLGRRARNRHTVSSAKNSSQAEYKKATALEAVIGFYYLTQNQIRLDELFEMIISQKEQ